ncbi:MAG: hypothetical protein B6U97_02200 [Candidatus Altiarchaeales archaeon ex4484_96]|nr:MAG: hypothetical protein B6U97_02200 [Candidatus Altiarchaeales archaeon ex4484_96]
MDEDHINAVDRLILLAMKRVNKPLSTYQIAKNANISWSTANTHCYKLKSIGVLDMKRVKNHFGQTKVMWRALERKKRG